MHSPLVLIPAGGSDGLFTHSALIGISWTLIMVWIRHKTHYNSQYSHGINFHVSIR